MVSVCMVVQLVHIFKAREHWECFVQKGPGVKVHVGSGAPCSQGDLGTVVLELAGQHPTI